MKKFLRVINLMLVFAFCAVAAIAQDGPPQEQRGGGMGMRMQMPSFAELDKNGDKKLSREETGQMPPQFFDRLDENKDGFIDETEWSRMRQRVGGNNARLAEMFGRFMDADKDTRVNREEFARLTQLFDALDKDKDGALTQEELGRFFQAMGELQAAATGGVEVNNLFEKYDKNKDGKIMAEEMENERTFKALDLDKNGSVTRDEAESALKELAARSRQRQPQQ